MTARSTERHQTLYSGITGNVHDFSWWFSIFFKSQYQRSYNSWLCYCRYRTLYSLYIYKTILLLTDLYPLESMTLILISIIKSAQYRYRSFSIISKGEGPYNFILKPFLVMILFWILNVLHTKALRINDKILKFRNM